MALDRSTPRHSTPRQSCQNWGVVAADRREMAPVLVVEGREGIPGRESGNPNLWENGSLAPGRARLLEIGTKFVR